MANESTVESSSIKPLSGLATLDTYFCMIYHSLTFVQIFDKSLNTLDLHAGYIRLSSKYFLGLSTLANSAAQQKRT